MLRNYHSCLLTLPCLNVLLVSICHILLHRDNGKVWVFFFFFFSCSPVFSYICLYQIWVSLQTFMKKTNISTTISIQILKDALLFICHCIFFVYIICFHMTALDLCLPPDFACGFRLPQCQLYEFKKKQ